MKKLIVIACAAVACAAFADRITLKSGSVLTGRLLGTEGEVIKFESADFGVLDVKPDSVASILDETAKKAVPVAEVKPAPKPPETWHGSVNASYFAARGNTRQNTWSIIANVNRRWEKDRFNADFGYYYGENGRANEDVTRTTDRWEAELKHDHFWLEKVYTYEDLRYERDMMQQLEGRYRVGLGAGYQWLDGTDVLGTGKWSFNQELGANWVKEEFEDNEDAKKNGFAALRYAHHLGFLPAFNDRLELFHNFEYLPEVDDFDKFLIKSDIGFSTKLIYDFDLLCKIEWEHNSKPAANLKKDDLRYIAGLGYKW